MIKLLILIMLLLMLSGCAPQRSYLLPIYEQGKGRLKYYIRVPVLPVEGLKAEEGVVK
jgi:uncharacterized protein YceK